MDLDTEVGRSLGYLGATRPMLPCVTLYPLMNCPKTIKNLAAKGLKKVAKIDNIFAKINLAKTRRINRSLKFIRAKYFKKLIR